MTEEQFLQAVEDESSTLEEAIEKRRKARAKRQGVSSPLGDEIGTLESTAEPSINEAPAEEVVEEDEESSLVKPKRKSRSKRRRSVPVAEDQNGLDEAVDEEGTAAEVKEPEKKKPKLKIKLTLKNDPLTPEESETNGVANSKVDKSKQSKTKKTKKAQNELLPVVENLLALMREQIDETDEHPRTTIFEKLPSKRDYPDYYTLIKHPIALDIVLRNAKKGQYNSLEDVKQDLQVMYDNAKFYNEEGSWVYNDAEKLNEFTDQWFENN